MPTAVNPKTGQRIALNEQTGQWEPFKTAVNPQTGERVQLLGGQWVPVQAEAPEPATFGDAVGRGVDQMQGMGYGALEAVGEAFGGDNWATEVGGEGRRRNAEEAAAYGPRANFSDIGGVGDFAQWAKETAGEQIPMMAPSLAGGLAGAAGGGAIGGPVGALVGGIAGAAVPSFILGTGEVQGAIKERGEDLSAPGYALGGGAAIAALDSILPAKVGGMLLSRFGKEGAEAIAQRAIQGGIAERVAKGAALGMATEAGTEALQEAIGEYAAATGTGTDVNPDLGMQMLEAAAAGGLMGGGAGAIGGAVSKPAAPVEQPQQEAPQAPPPAAPVQPRPTVAPDAEPTGDRVVARTEWGQEITGTVVRRDPRTGKVAVRDPAGEVEWFDADEVTPVPSAEEAPAPQTIQTENAATGDRSETTVTGPADIAADVLDTQQGVEEARAQAKQVIAEQAEVEPAPPPLSREPAVNPVLVPTPPGRPKPGTYVKVFDNQGNEKGEALVKGYTNEMAFGEARARVILDGKDGRTWRPFVDITRLEEIPLTPEDRGIVPSQPRVERPLAGPTEFPERADVRAVAQADRLASLGSRLEAKKPSPGPAPSLTPPTFDAEQQRVADLGKRLEASKPKAPEPVPSTIEDRERLENLKQMLEDNIATKRDNGEAVPEQWKRRLAEVTAQLGGEPIDADAVYSNVVEGHPQFDGTPALRNLVPIKVRSAADAERRLFQAQDVYKDMLGKVAQAEYDLKNAKTKAQQNKARKRISDLVNQGVSRENVDTLRNETLPELERLVREAERQFGKAAPAPEVNETPAPFTKPEAKESQRPAPGSRVRVIGQDGSVFGETTVESYTDEKRPRVVFSEPAGAMKRPFLDLVTLEPVGTVNEDLTVEPGDDASRRTTPDRQDAGSPDAALVSAPNARLAVPSNSTSGEASAQDSAAREAWEDGRWKARDGEKVYQRVPGMFGTPAIINGETYTDKGKTRVRVTGTNSMIGGEYKGRKTVPYDAGWTVVGDPKPEQDEQDRRDKEAREAEEFRSELQRDNAAAVAAAQEAIANGDAPLAANNAKLGLVVMNHHPVNGGRQVIGNIDDKGRIYTQDYDDADDSPRSNGPNEHFTVPQPEEVVPHTVNEFGSIERADATPVQQSDERIGLSWGSPNGERVIEGKTEVNGETRYRVRTGDDKHVELWDAAMVDRMQAVDAANVKSRTAAAAKDAEREAAEGRRKAEREDLDGFDAAMTPMQRGKALDALTRRVNYKGREISRRDLVREKVAGGSKIGELDGEAILENPDGSFLDGKAITKAGLDYARYLIDRADATQAEPDARSVRDLIPEYNNRLPGAWKIRLDDRDDGPMAYLMDPNTNDFAEAERIDALTAEDLDGWVKIAESKERGDWQNYQRLPEPARKAVERVVRASQKKGSAYVANPDREVQSSLVADMDPDVREQIADTLALGLGRASGGRGAQQITAALNAMAQKFAKQAKADDTMASRFGLMTDDQRNAAEKAANEAKKAEEEAQAKVDLEARLGPLDDAKGGTPAAVAKAGARNPLFGRGWSANGALILKTGTVPGFDAAINKMDVDPVDDRFESAIGRIVDGAKPNTADPIMWKFHMAGRDKKDASRVHGTMPNGDWVTIDAKFYDFAKRNGLTLKADSPEKPLSLFKNGDFVGVLSPMVNVDRTDLTSLADIARERGYKMGEFPAEKRARAQKAAPEPRKPKAPSYIDRLENYFRSGRIVPSYSGQDRVIAFERTDDTTGWRVRVQEVNREGSPVGSERVHSTAPDKRQLDAWEKVNPVGAAAEPGRSQAEIGPEPVEDAETEEEAATDNAVPAAIEDFGEKIAGARKDATGQFADALADTDVDIAAEPLSKIFPQPDYVKLAEGGIEPKALALIALMRSEIPAKPRKGYKLGRWVDQVRLLRGLASSLMDGSLTADQVVAEIRAKHPRIGDLADTAEVIAEVPPEHMAFAGDWRVSHANFFRLNGEKLPGPKPLFYAMGPKSRMVKIDGKDLAAPTLDELRQPTVDAIVSEAEALAEKSPEKRRTKVSIYQDRHTGDYFVGFKAPSGVIRLKTGFKSFKDADAYREGSADEIQAKIDAMRAGPNMRGGDNRPRVGKDHRDGDVTPEQFSDAFGFRGVQFGNYVEGPRRQQELNEAFDALMDLADVLGIPPRGLSLGGELGLAFGARGKGGRAKAHYEPAMVVINLTKTKGAGSLAHEWLHAVDNYFNKQDRPGDRKAMGGFMSEARERQGGTRDEVFQAWKAVEKAISDGDFATRQRGFDAARSKPYWSTTLEKAARSFERYVYDRLGEQEASNDYLVNIDTEGGAYPTETEMQAQGIRSAFDNLFNTIQAKEDGDNVILYSARNPDTRADRRGRTFTDASGARLTPTFSEAAPALEKKLRAELERMGLSDVSVRLVDTIDDGRSDGFYWRKIITLGLDGGIDHAAEIFNHEAVHAFSKLGLLSRAERMSLTDAVEKYGWLDKYRIPERYPTAEKGVQIEEAYAEAFRDWMAGRLKPRDAQTRRIFTKIRQFLERIISALRGAGFQTWEDVFQRMDSGEVGARVRPGVTSTGAPASSDGPVYSKRLSEALGPLRRNAAAQQALDALDMKNVRGGDVPLMRDMRWFQRYVVHPSTLASFHAPMAKLYNVVKGMGARRDLTNSELAKLGKPYFDLQPEQKAKVNEALELGRLEGVWWSEEELREGVTGTLQNADRMGERVTVKLTDDEIAAYEGVRANMDRALEMFRDLVLREQESRLGLEPGSAKSSRDLYRLAKEATNAREEEQIKDAARRVRDIENARMTGYVPFSRYGEVNITVRPIEQAAAGATGKSDPVASIRVEMPVTDKLKRGDVRNSAAVKAALAKLQKQFSPKTHEFSIYQQSGKLDEDALLDQALDIIAGLSSLDPDHVGPMEAALNSITGATANLDLMTPDYANKVRSLADKAAKFQKDMQGRGFRTHFFKAKNVAGYTADLERAIVNYNTGISGYLARREVTPAAEEALKSVDSKQPRWRDYMKTYWQYVNNPSEEWNNLRQMGFVWYLAGNLSSAIVNLSQVPMISIPYTSMFAPAGKVAAAYTRAYADAAKALSVKKGLEFFDPDKLPADVREEVRAAMASGELLPLETLEAQAVARGRQKLLRGLEQKKKRALDIVGSMYSLAERSNRLVTYMAGVRLAKSDPGMKQRVMKVLKDDALAREQLRTFTPDAFGRWLIDRTHYDMGKFNRPTVMRGPGAAILQFKGFTMQTLELYTRLATMHGREGHVALGIMAVALPFLFAGLWGLPGAEDLRDMVEYLYKRATGFDLDVDREVREIVSDATGSAAMAAIFTNGATRMTGLDVGRRIGMGNLLPDMTADDLAGIPASLTIGAMNQAWMYAQREQYAAAVAELGPLWIRNPVHAALWQTEGIRSQTTGKTIFTPDDVTGFDSAAKAVGFTSGRIAEKRAAEWSTSRQGYAASDARDRFYGLVSNALADAERARQAGDFDEAKRLEAKVEGILQDIAEHNATAEPEEVIQLRPSTIRQRVKQQLMGAEAKRAPKAGRNARDEASSIFDVE